MLFETSSGHNINIFSIPVVTISVLSRLLSNVASNTIIRIRNLIKS